MRYVLSTPVPNKSPPQPESKKSMIKPPLSEVPAVASTDQKDVKSNVVGQSFEKSILKVCFRFCEYSFLQCPLEL